MNIIGRWMTAGLVAVALGACTQNTRPLNFSGVDVAPSSVHQPAELKAVSMSTATPGEAAGKISPVTDIAVPAWKSALEDGIDRAAIFQDEAPKKLSLVVKITQLDVPTFGLDMTTTATARYEIVDRATHDTLFISDVTSVGTVPASYAFVARERVWESINRAVRANIQQLIEQLRGADLSKPVFPAAKPTS